MEKSANADDDEQSPKVKAEGLKKKVKTVIVKAEPVKVEQIKEKVSVKEEMAGHIEEGSNIEVLESEPSDSKLHARTVQRILKEYPEYSYSHPSEASVLVTMSSSKKQTMTWDAPTDQRLLLAVLAHYGEMKVDYDVLASMMGEHCTPRAVQERIKKLRKDAKAGFDSSSPAMATPGTASPAKATPSKVTKAKKTPAAPKANKGKRVAKAKAAQEHVDVEEPEEADAVEEEETQAPARKKRKYMDAKANAPASEPIGPELAEEMETAYDEAV